MKTTEKKTLIDVVAKGLISAASELEQLQVQLALGKAETRDLLEDIKKDLRLLLHRMKIKIRQKRSASGFLPILNAIEQLEVQLSLGEAETRDKINEQSARIATALHRLESELNPAIGKQAAVWHLKLEKFKAKLRLLSLTYKLRKIEAQQQVKARNQDFERSVKKMKAELEHVSANIRNNWADLRRSINESFHILTHHFLPAD